MEEVLSGGLDKRWEKRTRGFVGPPAAFAEDVDEGTAEELLKDNVNVTTVAAATMDLATHSRAPSPPPSTLNPLSLFFKGSKRVDIQTIFVEVKSANDTPFGLSAVLWTQNLSRALQFVDEIEAGFVQVNQCVAPRANVSYGGIKMSGLGKEYAFDSMINHFTQSKTVLINRGKSNLDD